MNGADEVNLADGSGGEEASATPASDGGEGPGPTWLSVPEVAQRLGVRQRDVRSAIADRRLLAARPGPAAAPAVPAELLVPGPDGTEVALPALRGTLIQLGDAGLTDDEVVAWLYRHDDALGSTPVAALRAGRTKSVRRAAQLL